MTASLQENSGEENPDSTVIYLHKKQADKLGKLYVAFYSRRHLDETLVGAQKEYTLTNAELDTGPPGIYRRRILNLGDPQRPKGRS